MTSEVRHPLLRPAWLVSVQAEGPNLLSVIVDSKIYSYTLVRPGLEERLPYVVGGHISDNSLFISSDVPEKYRYLILGHEIRHDTSLKDLPPEVACLESLKAEIKDARISLGDHVNEYLLGTAKENGFEGRKGFFNAVAKLYEDPQQAEARGAAFVEGINRSRDFLNGLNP